MKIIILFIIYDIEEVIFLLDRIYVIFEKFVIIKGEIIVNFSYLREEDIVIDVEFVRIRREVLDLFKVW